MSYNELPSNDQEELIAAGTEFMRVITEIYGPDKGMEMWDVISTAVGADYKGAVFFAMLTGNALGDVRLTKIGNQMVEAIKVVRRYTGYGLKEAKDAVDRVRDSATYGSVHTEKLVLVNKSQRRECVDALRAAGCEAN